MLSEVTHRIEEILLAYIHQAYAVDYRGLSFSTPPKIELGELAIPVAFELARTIKRPPRDIAQELAIQIRGVPGIWKVDVAGGGFLNLYLTRADWALRLRESISRGLYGRPEKAPLSGKVIVEHTNINPNKAAHIGHLRNASLGDSFIRCLRFLGEKVEAQNYLDNTGVQVADVVVGLQHIEGKTAIEVADVGGKFDYYCWDVYAKVAGFYQQSPENLSWRSKTLQAIEAGGNPTAELAQHVAMRVVRAHLQTMKRINVRYDLLPRESEILHLRFWDKAFALLREKQAIHQPSSGKNLGCWVMKLQSKGRKERPAEEDEKVIVRSDGTVTYVGKDLAYQLWKFGLLGLDFRYRPFQGSGADTAWVTTMDQTDDIPSPEFGCAEQVYNVIDARQSYLQAVVLQGLQSLGYAEAARNSIHFSYEMVALTPACCEELGFPLTDEDRKRPYVEVSGRKGLGVKADDLLDTLVNKALLEVQSRHELPQSEAESIANTIAVGALRYFMLRFSRNTVIAFDFEEALSFEGETGPYVQYAVVRANNIFRKLSESNPGNDFSAPAPESLNAFLTNQNDIWELVYHAVRLPDIVHQVQQTLELSQLAKYAFHQAQRFNLFYHNYHILSEPDPERKQNLTFVTDLVRIQLQKALDLLGCSVPQKM